MKGETQANRLERLMIKRQVYPKYTLALPLIEVKKSDIKKLRKGDILLLGLDSFQLILLDEQRICAEVKLKHSEGELEVIALNDEEDEPCMNKKYWLLILSFGTVESRKLVVGQAIKTTNMRFDQLIIQANNRKIAEGSLVTVDNKMAVQINEVKK
ncbi:MAG: FliM/FliN family flagellar motor C-terminal domain-containing protein [Sulfurimonas sp.]